MKNKTIEVQLNDNHFVWDQGTWYCKHDNILPPADVVVQLQQQFAARGIELAQPSQDHKVHHNVSVTELDPQVLQSKRFRDANPDLDPSKPCSDVDMTGKTPAERFAQHKAGMKASKYVKKHGLCLRPEWFQALNPMPYKVACETVALGTRLRQAGFAVWWN